MLHLRTEFAAAAGTKGIRTAGPPRRDATSRDHPNSPLGGAGDRYSRSGSPRRTPSISIRNPVVRCIGPITNERHPHVRGSRRPYGSRAVGDNENFEPALTEPLFSTAAMNFPAMLPPIRRSRFLVYTVASHTCDQIAEWLRITVRKSCDSVG